MGGFITKRVVLKKAGLIIYLFGFRAWVRCLMARHGSTFLGTLYGV